MKRWLLLAFLTGSVAWAAGNTALEEGARILAADPSASLSADLASTEDPVSFTVTTPQRQITFSAEIADVFSLVRGQFAARTIQAGPYTYILNWQILTPQGQPAIYDLATDIAEARYDKADFPDKSYPPGGYVENTYRPLSIVGPYVSFRLTGGSYWPGAAHPNGYDSFGTADISQPRGEYGYESADLLKMVSEDSLVAALKADPYLLKLVKSKNDRRALARARTFTEVYQALEPTMTDNCLYIPGYDNQLDSFALYAYAAATDQLSVRIPITAAAHVCEVNPTVQLGLIVRPQPWFRDLLKSQTGLLMSQGL